MNISLVGPNLLLAPDADPSDGTLDFVLLTEDQREEFDQYLLYRLERKQDALALFVRRAQNLRFIWHGGVVRFDDRAWPRAPSRPTAAVDGEKSKGEAEVVEVSLWRGGLEFLLPRLRTG